MPLQDGDEIDFNATLHETIDSKPLDHYKIVESHAAQDAKWRKSRKGNGESTAAIIDRYFRKKIKATEGGRGVTLTVLEVIALALHKSSVAGNKRAARVLDLYSKFGRDEPPPDRHVIALYELEGSLYRVLDGEG